MDKNKLIQDVISNIKSHKELVEKQSDYDLKLAMQNNKFKALELKKRDLILEIARVESNNNLLDKSLRLKYQSITNKLTDLADSLNLNPFNPNYYCKICKDTGYLDGKICNCVNKILFEKLKDISGITNNINFTFEKHNEDFFKGTKQENIINNLYKVLMKFANLYPSTDYNNLILSGGTGTGKTYAVSALGRALIDKGYFVLFLSAFNMHNLFLRYHTAPVQDKFLYMDNILNSDILIIDDLGTEPIFFNITMEYLQLILDERTNNHKPIFITTNLNPSDILDRYGERIFSRIINKRFSKFINIDGDDLRLIKQF